jgi:hypothetical protein
VTGPGVAATTSVGLSASDDVGAKLVLRLDAGLQSPSTPKQAMILRTGTSSLPVPRPYVGAKARATSRCGERLMIDLGAARAVFSDIPDQAIDPVLDVLGRPGSGDRPGARCPRTSGIG